MANPPIPFASNTSATEWEKPYKFSIGYPRDADVATGARPTRPGPYWFDGMAGEIVAIIEAAGLTFNPADTTQLLTAIEILIGGPLVNFSGTPLSGNAPLSVTFADLTSPAASAWAWTFGDGGTSTAQNPTHSYASAGSYTVALTVTVAGTPYVVTKTAYVSATATPISPAGLASNTAWIDFTDASSLSGAGLIGAVPVSAAGDTIAWAKSKDPNTLRGVQNSSYLGRAVYRGTSAVALYEPNIVNGASVGRYSASAYGHLTEYLLSSSYSSEASRSAILYANSGRTAVIAVSIYAAKADTGNSGGVVTNDVVIDDGGANQFVMACFKAGSTVTLQAATTVSGSVLAIAAHTIPAATFAVVSMRFDGTNVQIRVNGGAWVTTAASTAVVLTGGVGLGQGSSTLSMDVAHFATFNEAVSDANLLNVERYLGASVGLSF